MALSFNVYLLFCVFLVCSNAYVVPVQYTGLRKPEPFSVVEYCAEYLQGAHSRKISCLICKGFDISCFVKKTSTSTTTTTAPTTATPSTSSATTAKTTTVSTTTTTAPTTQ